jgi:ApaG protein
MSIATTNNIQVSVNVTFNEKHSDIRHENFIFIYQIQIQNQNDFQVQLLTREWFIFDSLDQPKIIKGEGVVGEQPIIEPGETYCYSSNCLLNSTIGFMQGVYTFKKSNNDELITVLIPKFSLIFPHILN